MPDFVPCDINAIVNDAVAYFRNRLPLLGKRIEISIEFGQLPLVDANQQLIEWVFENLFKNSVDAIVRADGRIEITTEYDESLNIVRITHGDNGKGISREDQKKIFVPGYTTKKRGWGLGLTLVKRIIEDYHNGRIYLIASQKEKGAVFCVELPVMAKKMGKKKNNKNRLDL
jgi:signal transduction histidine kinase